MSRINEACYLACLLFFFKEKQAKNCILRVLSVACFRCCSCLLSI